MSLIALFWFWYVGLCRFVISVCRCTEISNHASTKAGEHIICWLSPRLLISSRSSIQRSVQVKLIICMFMLISQVIRGRCRCRLCSLVCRALQYIFTTLFILFLNILENWYAHSGNLGRLPHATIYFFKSEREKCNATGFQVRGGFPYTIITTIFSNIYG